MESVVDPNFRRSVVLMLHHGEDEAVGLVLNRATDVPVEVLCESIDMRWNGSEEARVDWGGPVDPEHGWVLLGDGAPDDLDAERVAPGIRYSRSQDVLRDAAARPPEQLRVLLGYAGWGPGQLESEIAEGAWLVVPVSHPLVFDTDRDDLWSAAVRSLGIEPATLVGTRGIN